MAIGNGLARAMHGCRDIGSSVRDRPRSGLRVAGCATPAGGLGFPVTGSKRIPGDRQNRVYRKRNRFARRCRERVLAFTCIDPTRRTTIDSVLLLGAWWR